MRRKRLAALGTGRAGGESDAVVVTDGAVAGLRAAACNEVGAPGGGGEQRDRRGDHPERDRGVRPCGVCAGADPPAQPAVRAVQDLDPRRTNLVRAGTIERVHRSFEVDAAATDSQFDSLEHAQTDGLGGAADAGDEQKCKEKRPATHHAPLDGFADAGMLSARAHGVSGIRG